jgi:hypothetical protein
MCLISEPTTRDVCPKYLEVVHSLRHSLLSGRAIAMDRAAGRLSLDGRSFAGFRYGFKGAQVRLDLIFGYQV